MSVLPLKEQSWWMHYGDFRFRQIEILYNMARMDSTEAHNWLRDNLFQQRVDARKKQEYKAKFRGQERADWKEIQTEWMKYCLNLKYRDNRYFRIDLHSTPQLPVEDATATNYASNLFWGAKLIELESKKYYFGCNVLGKLLAELRTSKGKLEYSLPADMHLFGEPILDIWQLYTPGHLLFAQSVTPWANLLLLGELKTLTFTMQVIFHCSLRLSKTNFRASNKCWTFRIFNNLLNYFRHQNWRMSFIS